MTSNIVCECRNLYKSYGKNRVLRGCNLDIAESAMVGLVGENGSGKSTLVRCLLGFEQPDDGTVIMSGSTGYCPQEEIMNRAFTVNEHLSFIQSIYQKHCEVDENYLRYLVDRFQLADYLNVQIGKLSGGTRQKVQFISSILHQPAMLLRDEPYKGFDWEMYLAFWTIVDELCDNGTGILIITHLIYDRERFDHIYNLDKGKLYEES